ncbi:MAG: alpha-2-macroglobulin family protein [Chitinophagaceae bacterium]|nr:alpha-2-macroglobulin family protein [Chitinophagaceae bacterium]
MRVLLFALSVLILFSCNRNSVNLDHTNAKGEVQRLVNLTFRFSNAMVPDSLLNEWDSTQYVSFSPTIPGRFRWEQPDELVFSPSQPLAPATTFKGELNEEILQYTTFTSIKNDKINFFTPALKLEDLHISWVMEGQSNVAVPRADLYFNYPVSPQSLREKLTLQADGKPVLYSVTTLSDNSRISLTLQGIAAQDRDLEGKILIAGGIVPEEGANATKEEISTSFTIPSPYNLVINNVTAEHDGLSGVINVSASQQLSMENISSQIKIEPAVKFTVEKTDEGIAIRSDNFNVEKTYLLTLQKGLRGIVGGVLMEQSDNNIAFGEIEPYIRFATNKSVYLSSQGNRMIEMRIVNVPTVKVTISKIYESNLLTAQQYGYYPRERDNDEEYYDEYYQSSISFGDIIYEQEIDTRTLPKSGNSRLFSFNFEDRLPNFKGIYHIKVRSKNNYWVSDSRFISVSDIGLIAKEGQDKLFVFANSIKNASSIAGVNIVAYGNNNQVLGMGATNEDGVAEIAYTRKEFAGFRPAMIIAKTETDFNYLPFNSTRINTSRFEVGGKRINASMLDAFIYPERDIYRPGERINFSAIVRDRYWKIPGTLPVNFKFLLPNGKELRSFRKSLNEQGSTEGQIDISMSAITGTYVLEMYSSNDVLLATQNFSIEEFVPDRIRVTTTLDREYFQPGQSGTLNVSAVNFFGPPAANRKYEMEIQLRSDNFYSKKYSSYDFSVKNQGLSFDKVLREGTTNAEGNASETYEVPAMFKNSGLLESVFYTTVFDETGRPVSRVQRYPVYTQDVFFGVADDGYWYYPLNQAVKFPLIALDRSQKVMSNVKASVKVIKHEYRTVLSRSGSYFRYESQEDDKLISEQQVTVNGENTSYSFVPRSPGNYELRISVPGASGYVSRSFYSYGSWGGDNNSFEVSTEGTIDIETDKSTYKPGDMAKILFKTPFNGRLLITVEQDKVLSYHYANAEKRSASVDIKIGQEHLPNIFITATLIKPHGISEIPLTVAHGFQNMKVEETQRKNKVEIIAAKSARSVSTQQVTVKAAPNSFVTLAAVDNGVLQVSDFKTPDPYNFFYASRALQVGAYDLYPFLFPEVRGRLSSTGGSDEAEMSKRMNPMPAKRIKIVSYWSGIVKTNGDGQAKFSVPVPKFSGEIRLMAVGYKNEMFGSAEAAIKIADPIVISAALPRFLSPGDSITVPVTLTNTTSKAATGMASIKTAGPVKVNGSTQQQVNLQANSEQRVMFSVSAPAAVDTGKVMIEVQALGEKFLEETAIGVRPASPLQVLSGAGLVQGGKTERVNMVTMDFVPGTQKFQLMVSRNPLLQSAAQLRYLVRYPYGCTEQVVSSAFPQLYYGDIAGELADNNEVSNANKNVIEAIRKIRLRQLYNGAVLMWDNEGTENWWATIYAAHFLLEAKKAGFEVEGSLLSTMLNYINSRLRNKQTITYYYNRDQRKKIAPKEVAYSLYVLALASRANVPVMNYYKANTALLSLDSKYLLSVAYAIAGDRKRFGELLPGSFTGEESVPETGGSFYSPIRDEAIALNALIDVDPNNKQIPVMAKHVADQLKNRTWYSTQESSFSLLAMGKFAKMEGTSNATAELKVDGKTVAKFDGRDVKYISADATAKNMELVTKGDGKVYYYWQSEGVSITGQYKEIDNFIRVRRQFFDRFGRQVSSNEFNQNDLVIVKVSLERSFDTDVENVVITDIIPAGFEIENPRTKEIPGMEWIKDASAPTELDVRDDRIHLFVDLKSGRQVYYYAVRAVSPGTYRMGPVSATAMYNGEYHSYNGAGTVKILE